MSRIYAAFCWACFQLVVRGPIPIFSKLGLWLLPYAGDWVYRDRNAP